MCGISLSPAISLDVSIIITNYNYSKYIARSVRSCLGQRNVKCEIIVVDDIFYNSSKRFEKIDLIFSSEAGSLIQHFQDLNTNSILTLESLVHSIRSFLVER